MYTEREREIDTSRAWKRSREQLQSSIQWKIRPLTKGKGIRLI
jgi:hypothetical protein